jgi:hypothetical protein
MTTNLVKTPQVLILALGDEITKTRKLLGSAPDSKRLLFCTSPIFQNLEVSKSGPF